MWAAVLVVGATAQQGLLGSLQEQGFGRVGQCPVSTSNTGTNLATRHNHNDPCTAGLGVNEYRIGDDTFITRHADYYMAHRNGSCISAAPENTTCENLYQYRRELTPYVAVMEKFWVRYDGGGIPEGASARHQSRFQNVSEMDAMMRYVAQTLDFGPAQDYPKLPLSQQIGNDTYFFFVHIVVEAAPNIEYSVYRRFDSDNGVQYRIDNQDEIMANFSVDGDGEPYRRRGDQGERNWYGMYDAHAYVSHTSNSSILSGIIMALPLEIILSDGLENVANGDILRCGGVDFDGTNSGSLSPVLERHRLWVMPTKPCASNTVNSPALSFEIITTLLVAALLLALLVVKKIEMPSPSRGRAAAYLVLAGGLVVILATPSVFEEFGEKYGVYSQNVCSTPADDHEFEGCNSAYAYRCILVQVLAAVALGLGWATAAAEVGALYSRFDWRHRLMLVYTTIACAVVVVHYLFLVNAAPSGKADCGRARTATAGWGVWALGVVAIVYCWLTFDSYFGVYQRAVTLWKMGTSSVSYKILNQIQL